MSFTTFDTNTNKITKVYEEKELSDAVFNSIQYYREQAEHWQRMYILWHKYGKEQANKELQNEIETLQKRIMMSYGEFSSPKEKDAYEKFVQEHMHDRKTSRANGGKCPYLIPTSVGIGIHLEVVCPICGEKKDITDVEVW